MIRAFRKTDLAALMQIWLNTNIRAHDFIPASYWTGHLETVQALLPQAELYVYEDKASGEALGFIGLTDDYIAGIFVKEAAQSKGIGKLLLDHVKALKTKLRLNVYQKNKRAVAFYRREQFLVKSESIDGDTQEKELTMAWEKPVIL